MVLISELKFVNRFEKVERVKRFSIKVKRHGCNR